MNAPPRGVLLSAVFDWVDLMHTSIVIFCMFIYVNVAL
jgi:hypothetical protein